LAGWALTTPGPELRSGLTFWEKCRAPLVAAKIGNYLVRRGGLAVDLGCGSGAVADLLAGRFEAIVGIDIDYEALRAGQGGRRPLLAGEAERLPLRSNSVDVLFSYGVLHHTNLARALAEIERVVAPTGAVVLIDFCAEPGARPTRFAGYARDVLRAYPRYRARLGTMAAARVVAVRLSPSWRRHVRSDTFLTAEEYVREYSAILAGAEFYREDDRMAVIWGTR
jgi:ubiquinone/menaquinone biosynthesis C-methylase UbiE